MSLQDDFRRALIDGDIDAACKMWATRIAPNSPQPSTKAEREITFHMARTVARSIPLRLRKYSDRWLRTRYIGSFLEPEHQLHQNERR